MEFFKALTPDKNNPEEFSEINNNSSSGFKVFINCIWNVDFPKSWNNT